MKNFILLIFILFHSISYSQNSNNLTDYVVKISSKNSGHIKLKLKKDGKQLLCQDNLISTSTDQIYYFLSICFHSGNSKNGTAKDSLKRLYSPKNYIEKDSQSPWGKFSCYDSIANTIKVIDNNPYYGSTTTYSFDSLGRIVQINSGSYSEVSFGGRGSCLKYFYFPEKNIVKINSLYILERDKNLNNKNLNGNDSEIEWNPLSKLPVKEIDNLEGVGNFNKYEYFYKKDVLEKLIYTETRNNQPAKKEYFTYYFYK